MPKPSEWVGDWPKPSPRARRLYDRAGEVLGYDLAKLCFEGPAEELDSTVCSQPALFVTSLAALESLRAESPDVVLSCEYAAGLSLGEYTAMVFAGVMEFEDGLTLVQKRGAAMQEAADDTPSGMVSILGLERVQVEDLCQKARQNEILEIANLLCPGNIAISGTNAACERAAELAPKLGAMKAMPLAVAGAFHTQIMRPADERLAEALADLPMRCPKIPVVSNVDARPHDDPGGNPPAAGPADPFAGALGGVDAVPVGPGGGSVLRSRPRPGAAGIAEANRSESGLSERRGVVRERSAQSQLPATNAQSRRNQVFSIRKADRS